MNKKIRLGFMYSINQFPSPLNPEVKYGWGNSSDPLDEKSCFVEHMIYDGRIKPYNLTWQDIKEDLTLLNLYNLETGENLSGGNLNKVVDVLFFGGFGKVEHSRNHSQDRRSFLENLAQKITISTINPLNTLLKYAGRGKTYLLELQGKGVSLPKTEIATGPLQVEKIIHSWEDCIVKPLRGFGGHGIQRFPGGDYTLIEKFLEEEGEIVVQKFIPEVIEFGERSVYIIHKEVKYTVQKKPKEKNFMANSLQGGTISLCEPTKQEIELAHKVIEASEIDPIILRVDMIGPRNKPVVMEVTSDSMGMYPRETGHPEMISNIFIEMILKTVQKA